MGAAQISHGSTYLTFKRGPADFIAEDSARVHDNLSTSGLRERVFEFNDILISFTMPGLLIGDDFTDWKNFYAWALSGSLFSFVPNSSVTVSAAPWSGGVYGFNCVLEDSGFKPKRLGMGRYSLDVQFRVNPDAYAPTNSGQIMEAFWGGQPL